MFINLKDMPETCVEQIKTRHVYLTEDTKRGWTNAKGAPTNLLIEGENYHALRMLEYTHTGKVDVIYIDPPYNTGNKDFVYSDDFSTDVPDGDQGDIDTGTLAYVNPEDPYRHSKWASFMVRRLRIARNLLSERGVIFISIDDREMAYCKLLCDAIFGEDNFVANMIWKKKHSGAHDSRFIDTTHEYVLVYAKDAPSWKDNGIAFNKISAQVSDDNSYAYSDQYVAERGKYKLQPLAAAKGYVESLFYPIICPDGSSLYPNSNARGNVGDFQWVWKQERVLKAIKDGFIAFNLKKDGHWTVSYKQYQYVDKDGNKIDRGNPQQSIINNDTFNPTNVSSSAEIRKIFNGESSFDYAKPSELIKRLLFLATDKSSIVLDFFAGSGTTGQAVAELNREDGGNRQFILVTNNEKSDKLPNGIARDATYPRLERTIKDDTNLVYMKVSTRKHEKTANTCTKVAQLEVDNKLLPLLKVKFDAFEEVESTDRYVVLHGRGDFYLGVYFNYTESPSPLGVVRRSFQTHVDSLSENNEVLFNIPSEGYASDYFNFIQATNPKE